MGGMTAPPSAAGWLAQLAADRAPPPPGWWPPASGWWLLGALLLAAAALATGFGRRWWRQRGGRALRRSALDELQRLERGGAADAVLARELESLMRRYALARFGRDAVARLSGEAWLAFVVAHGAAGWAGDSGRALLRAAYGGAAHGGGAARAERARWIGGARAFVQAPVAKA